MIDINLIIDNEIKFANQNLIIIIRTLDYNDNDNDGNHYYNHYYSDYYHHYHNDIIMIFKINILSLVHQRSFQWWVITIKSNHSRTITDALYQAGGPGERERDSQREEKEEEDYFDYYYYSP